MFLKILNGDLEKRNILIRGINKRCGNSLYLCNDYDTHYLVKIEDEWFLVYPYEYSVVDIEPSDRTIECYKIDDTNFIKLLQNASNCKCHYEDEDYDRIDFTFVTRTPAKDIPFVGRGTPEKKLPLEDLISWSPINKEKVVYILKS